MGKTGLTLVFVYFVSGMCECVYVRWSDVFNSQAGTLPLVRKAESATERVLYNWQAPFESPTHTTIYNESGNRLNTV
jgi:hypothetical protein